MLVWAITSVQCQNIYFHSTCLAIIKAVTFQLLSRGAQNKIFFTLCVAICTVPFTGIDMSRASSTMESVLQFDHKFIFSLDVNEMQHCTASWIWKTFLHFMFLCLVFIAFIIHAVLLIPFCCYFTKVLQIKCQFIYLKTDLAFFCISCFYDITMSNTSQSLQYCMLRNHFILLGQIQNIWGQKHLVKELLSFNRKMWPSCSAV